MVVAIKIPNHTHQNFFNYKFDMLIVSFDTMEESGCPLRVGELVVDGQYDIPLIEPWNVLLRTM